MKFKINAVFKTRQVPLILFSKRVLGTNEISFSQVVNHQKDLKLKLGSRMFRRKSTFSKDSVRTVVKWTRKGMRVQKW